jgi:hypothetical protein
MGFPMAVLPILGAKDPTTSSVYPAVDELSQSTILPRKDECTGFGFCLLGL